VTHDLSVSELFGRDNGDVAVADIPEESLVVAAVVAALIHRHKRHHGFFRVAPSVTIRCAHNRCA
jgi:hypothetical protein